MSGAPEFTERVADGLLEARFSVTVDGERVPGLLVRDADAADPAPLVLLQHPGRGSKDDPFVAGVACAWARRGWICAGIDAPLHGERDVVDPGALLAGRSRLAPETLAGFARDVSATIDAIADRHPVDLARLGYVGYSLGAMLGVSAVAADGRFRAAAFCLVGEGLMGPATGPGSPVPGLAGVAVRLVAKERDELIPRAATEALYEALPGEKDLVWLPGGHFEIGRDVVDAAGVWLRARL